MTQLMSVLEKYDVHSSIIMSSFGLLNPDNCSYYGHMGFLKVLCSLPTYKERLMTLNCT